MFSLLDRNHSVAGENFNRWLVPPAALCIHLAIGQAYAWSVFNLPLTRLYGIEVSTERDWTREQVIWIFSLAIAFLGISAAFGGKWLETAGPRKAMFLSATFFSSGFMLSALGAYFHWIALIYLGYGVIGGCGLGIGYISPVSTLIKWFPDRPGMATGLAIMGFGGGAMIGAPLALALMKRFSTATSTGVIETFLVMGVLYWIVMMIGAFTIRIPPDGWKPKSFAFERTKSHPLPYSVHADVAIRTPQFYLLWCILCFNVTAGIGILGKASDMIQDMFDASPAAGSGFVGLLSISNMVGRFFWSSCSDIIGRRATYGIYLGLGAVLYAALPSVAAGSRLGLFVTLSVFIMSMYGGGFATIPAYLKDLFGTMHVGAIHGRLLTAWSLAGILGPVLLTRFAEYSKRLGTPKQEAYSQVLYLMSGLLLIGFLCNWGLRPVDPRYHFRRQESLP